MSEDIEKLKEAAFKLAEMHRNQFEEGQAYPVRVWKEAVATIEAFKPKVEPVECWVNVYPGAQQVFHTIKASADINLREDGRTVHLREVTPVEWERWTPDELRVIRDTHGGTQEVLEAIVAAHNAEMQRVTGTEGK